MFKGQKFGLATVVLIGVLAAVTRSAPAKAASEAVVYSFKGGPDGEFPASGLISVGDILYGTTPNGGANGAGTVFKVTSEAKEKILYSFAIGGGGYPPAGQLLYSGGVFYGATTYGGGNGCGQTPGCGVIYKLTKKGVETVLYLFGSHLYDGESPVGGLKAVNGSFYGVTGAGGRGDCGGNGCPTLYVVTPSGSETVLLSFGSGVAGTAPGSGPIAVGGSLYGTTGFGGDFNSGTVYSFNLSSGLATVLHSFGNNVDGAIPETGLTLLTNEFFGATGSGGAVATCNQSIYGGCGTIFKVNKSGNEKVLHSFAGGADGALPMTNLLNLSGTLYGTTKQGGGTGCGGNGCGTLFAISKAGIETVVYAFKGGADGAFPSGNLVEMGGAIYGTTQQGGADDYGTVFKLVP